MVYFGLGAVSAMFRLANAGISIDTDNVVHDLPWASCLCGCYSSRNKGATEIGQLRLRNLISRAYLDSGVII